MEPQNGTGCFDRPCLARSHPFPWGPARALGRHTLISASWLRRFAPTLLWTLAGSLALAATLSSSTLRNVVRDASARVSIISVLATIPGQLAACLLCGSALFVLQTDISWRASAISRVLRDAGANLLFVPGLGEVIGARALVLAGSRTRTAVTASALDNLAETAAQIPFILLALSLVPVSLIHTIQYIPVRPSIPPGLYIAALVLAGSFLVGFCFSRLGHRAFLSVERRGRAELSRWITEVRRQQSGLPRAFIFHTLAWAMGGIQIWMVALTLHCRISLIAAIVIDSLTYAARAIAFFVPAGVVVQEASLVFAAGLYGLSPVQSLAIALVLRLRDVIFGLPLLFWPLFEARRLR